MIAKDRDVSGINSRLGESAVGDQDVELILVLRGKVRRAAGSDRWRIRVAGRHVFTFSLRKAGGRVKGDRGEYLL